MPDRPDDQPSTPDGRPATSGAVPALVEEQVETARAEVFRAYLRARDKARELADEDDGPHGS